jgi:hypothetical protein
LEKENIFLWLDLFGSRVTLDLTGLGSCCVLCSNGGVVLLLLLSPSVLAVVSDIYYDQMDTAYAFNIKMLFLNF